MNCWRRASVLHFSKIWEKPHWHLQNVIGSSWTRNSKMNTASCVIKRYQDGREDFTDESSPVLTSWEKKWMNRWGMIVIDCSEELNVNKRNEHEQKHWSWTGLNLNSTEFEQNWTWTQLWDRFWPKIWTRRKSVTEWYREISVKLLEECDLLKISDCHETRKQNAEISIGKVQSLLRPNVVTYATWICPTKRHKFSFCYVYGGAVVESNRTFSWANTFRITTMRTPIQNFPSALSFCKKKITIVAVSTIFAYVGPVWHFHVPETKNLLQWT